MVNHNLLLSAREYRPGSAYPHSGNITEFSEVSIPCLQALESSDLVPHYSPYLVFWQVGLVGDIRLVKRLNIVDGRQESVIVGLTVEVQVAFVVVIPQRRLGDRCPFSSLCVRVATLDALQCATDCEELVGVDLEVAVADVEACRWPAGPLTVDLRSVDPRLNAPELLLVVDTSEIAHVASDELAYRAIYEIIIETDLQSHFEIADAGLVAETELEELVYLAGAKVRQSREFVNDHDVERTVFDIGAEELVLFAAVGVSPTDDIGVRTNLRVVVQVVTTEKPGDFYRVW